MRIAPEEIDESTVLHPADHVRAIEVDDRLLLVDEEAGRGHALNPTGSLVWRLFDSASPLGDLVDDLSDVFASPRDEVAHSVKVLVLNLAWLGMFDNVVRSIESLPIDIEYAGPGDCDEPVPVDGEVDEPSYDDRYLAAPPNL